MHLFGRPKGSLGRLGGMIRRQTRNLDSWLNRETIPGPVITELERAKKAPRLFDRIAIWSRTDDPMAVGIIGEEKPHYFLLCAGGINSPTIWLIDSRAQLHKDGSS